MEGWLLQVIACNLQPLGWVVVGVSAKMAVVNWPTLDSGLAALPCSVWRQSPRWLPPWTACPTFPWSRWRWPAPTWSASQPHQVPTGPWFYLGEQRKIIKRRKENAAFWWKLPIECVRSQCVRMNPSQWVYGDVQNLKLNDRVLFTHWMGNWVMQTSIAQLAQGFFECQEILVNQERGIGWLEFK